MNTPHLVFLGPAELPGEPRGRFLACEGRALEPGARIPLARKRSPWKSGRGAERVIIGSRGDRADVLLAGEGIRPEHARVYISAGDGLVDLRALDGGSTRLGGRPVERLEWVRLQEGDELELGPWRFRYLPPAPEVTPPKAPASRASPPDR